MSNYGIVIVSHSANIAQGIYDLIQEVAKDVSITYVGGTEEGGIGTSFETASQAMESNSAESLLAFYDLGSAKMNLEMAIEFTTKEVEVFDVPVVEGTYTAAALLQAGVDLDTVKAQLAEMKLNK
ncbi:PTS-dependent dihydroxyacetone kinase phosphotransferase subunit DhaM [Aerococcaceae bacterium DSM 109653]|uniref:phosphoenolpyruvate--glycerone phosphotransferase n=1 Tax=Fundicoccus ignavus TaxID=2664442 RepID=A0A844BYC0_9LACT|nr:dihydroxyacetone kinase phosphoryl donor subunit DhaM [Fundicoccus ignavus]MRI82629.1 PTS-dependent dihydroxyacetone kinase phosphotransferase subunit DhaM [Fundicoccus ignavus]